MLTDEGIKINILVFRFISPLIPKEIRSLNKDTILKDKERICRTKGHLTEKSLDDQLTDNEIEIFSYSPITFLHKHQHIVQTPCEKEFSGKDIKVGTTLTISFSQYEWTDSLTDEPNKIIIDDILTPLIVSSNTHITDV